MGNFVTSGPNQAIIISGRRKDFEVIVGGTQFVWNCTQRASFLSLEIHTLDVESNKVLTSLGVAVSVVGVAQVKVGEQEIDIRTAANQFLDNLEDDIKKNSYSNS